MKHGTHYEEDKCNEFDECPKCHIRFDYRKSKIEKTVGTEKIDKTENKKKKIIKKGFYKSSILK